MIHSIIHIHETALIREFALLFYFPVLSVVKHVPIQFLHLNDKWHRNGHL